MASDETCQASDKYYDIFESSITGRWIHSDPPIEADEVYRESMFPAHVIRDAAMAHKVTKLM